MTVETKAETDKRLTFEAFSSKISERFEKLIEKESPLCPMCRSTDEWSCSGYAETPMGTWDLSEVGVIRSIPIVCNNCGFIAHFAAKDFE